MNNVVYLDHNATTPLDERVFEAMLPYLKAEYGNPSSVHSLGRAARAGLDLAREQVAALVNAHPSQVVFTSGGTEANNAAIKGVAFLNQPGRIALSAIEHASVSAPVRALQRFGWQVDPIAVDQHGRVSTEAVEACCHSDTSLISVMWANNETGTLQDISALATVTAGRGVLLHTDAVQAVGKVAVDFSASGAQLMSLSAHKIYGPKGVGALIVDKRVDWEPLLHGGGQERQRRGGTENLAAIVGFGKAAEIAMIEFENRHHHVVKLREQLERELIASVPSMVIFSKEAERLPNTVFLAIPGIEGETLITALDRQRIAVSSGSACGSSEHEPSFVLKAMGVDSDLARGAIRISLGKDNTIDEVKYLVKVLTEQVKQFQSMAPLAWA